MEQSQGYQIVVVGAGIVGAAAATALGRDGHKVLLIGKDWREPDRIVGELLQPGGLEALRELGLDHCVEGIDSIRTYGYAVYRNGKYVQLKYPPKNGVDEPWGAAFHHGRFIMNLRNEARNQENVTCVAATVNSLINDEETGDVIGVSCTSKGTEGEYYAPLTLVADGCFSKFRKDYVNKDVIVKSHFVGLILNDCELPFPSHGHVILANPSPILLYQIATHDTRILIDIPGKLPSTVNNDMTAYLKEFVCPQLPKSLRDSFLIAVDAQKPRSMPCQWLPPSPHKQPGMILLGDANNMRHPLTGGGMTVAFWDVVHLVKLFRKHTETELSDTAVVARVMKRHAVMRKPLAGVINTLAQALYALFAAGDHPYLRVLQEACFAYFELGGICISTPVSLLAGMRPEPMTLFLHFFAVAFLGLWRTFSNSNIFEFPQALLTCFMALYTACVVFLPVMYAEIM
ncbi:squalene epoxidase-domain-containing protein, partial [Cladochytrium replicatum]